MKMRASIKFDRVGKAFTGSTKVNGTLFLAKGDSKDQIRKEIKEAIKEFAY